MEKGIVPGCSSYSLDDCCPILQLQKNSFISLVIDYKDCDTS